MKKKIRKYSQKLSMFVQKTEKARDSLVILRAVIHEYDPELCILNHSSLFYH